jgi:hypothetical protein
MNSSKSSSTRELVTFAFTAAPFAATVAFASPTEVLIADNLREKNPCFVGVTSSEASDEPDIIV